MNNGTGVSVARQTYSITNNGWMEEEPTKTATMENKVGSSTLSAFRKKSNGKDSIMRQKEPRSLLQLLNGFPRSVSAFVIVQHEAYAGCSPTISSGIFLSTNECLKISVHSSRDKSREKPAQNLYSPALSSTRFFFEIN